MFFEALDDTEVDDTVPQEKIIADKRSKDIGDPTLYKMILGKIPQKFPKIKEDTSDPETEDSYIASSSGYCPSVGVLSQPPSTFQITIFPG